MGASRAEREKTLQELELAAMETEAVRLRGQLSLYRKWQREGRSPKVLRLVLRSIHRDSSAALGRPYNETAIERSHNFGAQLKVKK